MHTKADIKQNMNDLGLRPGDAVMVHASLRAVGPVMGGTDVLIDAILEAIAPDGAMMMYVGCESPFDEIGRGRWSVEEEAEILKSCPAFDPQTARACRDFGALAELFRTYAGTICSNHVGWRMAANGERAPALMADHPLNYGADAGSPMDKLVQAGGKVMLVGSDLDQVTLLHYAEGLANIPDKKTVNIQVPLLISGERQWVAVEEHNSSTGILDWPDRFFEAIVKDFVQDRGIVAGKIGNAPTYLLDTVDLVQYAVSAMEIKAKAMKPRLVL